MAQAATLSPFTRALSTTVGTKFLVAASGAALLAFVFGHMLGNLQIYVGADAINTYAATLKNMPGPLWVARIGLLAALGAHIWGIARLTRLNQAARPVAYAGKQPIASTLFSRTMLPSGLIILAFVIFHLLHFTVGLTHPEHFALRDEMGRHDVYSMTVYGFQQPLVAAGYILAMGLLGAHLLHGAASLFQTTGLSRADCKKWIELGGRGLALAIVLGNISIPLACLLGVVKPAQ